jgi:hyperosmotically inducible periplasmic protein
MNNSVRRTSALVIAAAAALALIACERHDERTAGEKLDAAINKTEQTADAAKADIQKGLGDAKATVQQEAAEAKADATAAAERAKAAFADSSAKTGTAIGRAADKIGDKLSDAAITTGVNAEFAKDRSLSAMRINVDTSNGHVSLRGTAPSGPDRERATTLAKSVEGVVAVDNHLALRE